MSATLFDDDDTPLVRDRCGELVPDAVPPTPSIPETCPDCGLRRGRHAYDCEIGGNQ